MTDQVRICSVSSPEGTPERLLCLGKVVKNASSILTCESSLNRYEEAIAFDLIQSKKTFGQYPKEPTPQWLSELFDKVTQGAEKVMFSRFRKPVWSLTVFKNNMVNATAGAGGLVFASSGLWTNPAGLTRNEIAAVLAHEASHVMLEHSLDQGCQAIEWISAENTIEEAMEIFREDLFSGGARKDDWMRVSQNDEKQADALAT